MQILKQTKKKEKFNFFQKKTWITFFSMNQTQQQQNEIARSGRPHHFGTLEKNNWKNLLWKQKDSIQFFAIVNGLYYQHITTTTKTKKKQLTSSFYHNFLSGPKWRKKKSCVCVCVTSVGKFIYDITITISFFSEDFFFDQ